MEGDVSSGEEEEDEEEGQYSKGRGWLGRGEQDLDHNNETPPHVHYHARSPAQASLHNRPSL